MCNISDVVSDHFPLKTTVSINVRADDVHHSRFVTRHPHMNWSGANLCEQYASSVNTLAGDLPSVNIDDITDHGTALTQVNIMCDALKDIMHNSVERLHDQKHSTYNGNVREKPLVE
jgi:cation transport regulator ChaC